MDSPDLLNLLRAYSALAPPKLLTFPADLPFTVVHDYILGSVLLNPHLAKYPPSAYYQHTFWRWAIGQLEALMGDSDFELDEQFYERYVTMLSVSQQTQSNIASPPPSFVTHYWKSPSVDRELQAITGYDTATLLESRMTIENGTTGLRTWRASFVLAQYLISHPELVTNKNVLELGSGTGFLGIIMGRLQMLDDHQDNESTLWLTDVHENVLKRCCNNVHLSCNISSQHKNLHTRVLDWSDALNHHSSKPLLQFFREARLDVVLGADLVYHPDIIPALVSVLCLVLTLDIRRTAAVILALTIRNEETWQIFLSALEAKHLLTEFIDLATGDESPFFQLSEGIDHEVKVIKVFGG